MMSLIGVDLTIPTDTDMNRNPAPRSRTQTAGAAKRDPEPAVCDAPPFRRSSMISSRTKSAKGGFAESKPMTTVSYSLGDQARKEQDMAAFHAQDHIASVKSLADKDYVFVRRSGGKFCFAVIKSVRSDPNEGIVMELYVNEAGATKIIPMSGWERFIRPIRPHVVCHPSSCVREGKHGSRRHTDVIDRDPDCQEGKNQRSRGGRSGNRRASCPEVQDVDEKPEQQRKQLEPELQPIKNESHSRRSRSDRRSSCPESMQNEDKLRDIDSNDKDNSPKIRYPSITRSLISSKLRASSAGNMRSQDDVNEIVPRLHADGPQTSQDYDNVKNLWLRRNSSPPSEIEMFDDVNMTSRRYSENDSVVPRSRHRPTPECEEKASKSSPADYLDRHLPIHVEKDMHPNETEDEYNKRQLSENTTDTATSSFRSSIATNYGSMIHKSSLRSSQFAIDEEANDNGANNINCNSYDDDESRHVKWDITSQSFVVDSTSINSLDKDCHLHSSMPAIYNPRPLMRRCSAEHESDGHSALSKQRHLRRSTAADVGGESQEGVSNKIHHSRRATVIGGLLESQKFNESQLLSAFAAIQTKK
jgi:hypothetical protein